ncbi:MAG TPA: amidohydrolase family protein [Acidimicrobiales bacterium]|nr:amidohydrolase family protein [Acidimicrobiales bacterium]
MIGGGRRVLDADGHVIEPGGLFSQWTGERLPLDLPPTTPMTPCGSFELLQDQFDHGFDTASYLRAMDAQGIDIAVVYPSVGLFAPFLPELSAAESAAACRAYNDWIAGYCEASGGRVFGAGILPLADVGAATKEVARCAGDGLVAMMARPNFLYGRNLGDPTYDPMHAAIEELDLVLAVHEGLGMRGQPTIGGDRFSGFAARHALSHPMEQMAAMTSLMFDGALDRHPNLRVAFLESGSGWLPYWLHRLDEHAEWMAETELDWLQLMPSEYFVRQCAISSEADDALAAAAIDAVGAARVMWASDFPHPDAVFPDSARAFAGNLSVHGASEEQIDAVLWSTPLGFYRIRDRIGGSA